MRFIKGLPAVTDWRSADYSLRRLAATPPLKTAASQIVIGFKLDLRAAAERRLSSSVTDQ